jgi:hypothetical protein
MARRGLDRVRVCPVKGADECYRSGMSPGRPDSSEAPEYYFKYINQVPEGDIRRILEDQTPPATQARKGN